MAEDFSRSEWPCAARGVHDIDDPRLWLGETRQLDLSEPKLRITSQMLTQSIQTVAGRAAAVQAFVRRVPFVVSPDAARCTAGEVLRRRRGDGRSKGALFVALCRAAGIPARLRVIDIRSGFLAGLQDDAPEVVPHVVAEVHVGGRWLCTDGYVLDPVLFAHAKRLLRERGADAGWGLVAQAQGTWGAGGDCMQQFRPTDVVRRHHPVDEPSQFAMGRAAGVSAWPSTLKALLAAARVNRRLGALRRARA